ncbi:MAG TPA: hypothetical protein VEX70_00360 [Pyrinomonadaceae bacterium]|nr:hypothetical protein [Pyrinomonadaceae bacterium]
MKIVLVRLLIQNYHARSVDFISIIRRMKTFGINENLNRNSQVGSLYILLFLMSITLLSAGCTTLASKTETGVVIARRAQVRSSFAVVAADLSEVVRGDVVDILDSTTAENGERWLRVRAHDAENTEGWIEARNVMPQDLLDRSIQAAAEDKDIPAQAAGQLRASTNLRSSADRSNADNILLKLESGAHFEIVGWKRVPKPKTSETTESDDAPKSGAATQTGGKQQKDSGTEKEAEELNELWYKVRLPRAISPAPAGWVYAKQVELTVPSDIIFYRTGREFVAWQRLDDAGDAGQSAPKDKDAAKEVQAGSWVILEKSSSDKPSTLEDPDFDRIFVLGYDKSRQEHYTAYRSPDLDGRLPLRIENNNGEKFFTVKANDNGQLVDVRYKVYRDDRGNLRVDAQGSLPKREKKK